ncbi:MMPL family transporter [Shewanella sp. GXUN23E]|uniref:MMPL family transporter n=1 Tax=Shewanella sp. GXUN23E TaxID=3422498 RepID=UPI003D7DFEC2
MSSPSDSKQPTAPRLPVLRWLAGLVWLAVMVLAAMVLGWKFAPQFLAGGSSPIETNILKLLPQNQQDPLSQRAFEQIAGQMEDQLLFLIKAPSDNSAIEAASAFSKQLATLGWLTDIQGQISEQEQQAWASLYYPHKANLLTTEQQQRLQTQPQAQTQKVVQAIYNPFSGVTAAELGNDPFLLFRDFLQSLGQQAGKFRMQQGYLLANQPDAEGKTHSYVLLTARLTGSPYSPALQSKLPQLEQLEHSLAQQRFDGQQAQVLHTGVLFYAAFGTQSAKDEISTIGLGSLLGVVLLLLLIYRSALPLLLALLSIGSGLLCALAGTLLIFGKVHLFSLVFGASLIGVSIDYAFHYLTDRLAAGSHWDPLKGLRHIFAAITLGLVTSLVGYLSMLVAPFPGLQQLALFSAIGLIGAYLTVVCWYPLLAASKVKDAPLPLVNLLSQTLALWQRPGIRALLPTGLLLISILGLYHVHYDDDIRQLQALPAALQAQEAEIKAVTGMGSTQQMLLISAASEQALLQALAHTDAQLQPLTQTGQLASFTSLGTYLPSIASQQHNFTLINQLYRSQGPQLAASLGMKQLPTAPEQFSPLTPAQLLASPAAQRLKFLWLGQDASGQYSAVILLSGIQDVQAIKALEVIPDPDATNTLTNTPVNPGEAKAPANSGSIRLLDKADEISSLFGEYRVRVTELLLLAFGLIFALLALRFGARRSLWIMLPTLVAAIAGLAVTNLTGLPLNLFNLLAVILILGIGIDYSLFFAEQGRRREHDSLSRQSTLLAISLSAATTLLSFGLLALSNTMAIHSFGITVLTGIIVAWFLAPISMEKMSMEKMPMEKISTEKMSMEKTSTRSDGAPLQ